MAEKTTPDWYPIPRDLVVKSAAWTVGLITLFWTIYLFGFMTRFAALAMSGLVVAYDLLTVTFIAVGLVTHRVRGERGQGA